MADSNGASANAVGGARGPAYPFIDLRRAIERAQVVADKGGGRQPMAPESFYSLWNLGAKSSGARQTIAALGYYGLIDHIGKGKDRRAKLTDLAKRIVFDQRENSPERAAAIRQAAIEPSVFREMFERYGHIIPADSVLQSFLMMERGFTKQGAEAATDSYRNTFDFAGLGEPVEKPDENDSSPSDNTLEYGGARVGDIVDYAPDGVIANPEAMRVRAVSPDQAWIFVEGSQTGLEMEHVVVRDRPDAGVVRDRPTMPLGSSGAMGRNPKPQAEGYRLETFDTDEGPVEISWPSNLSPQSVEDMHSWVELLMKRIERRAKQIGMPDKNEETRL